MDSPTLRRPAPPPGFSYDDAEPAAAPAAAAPTSIERPAPPPGFSYEAADAPAPKLQRPGRSFARAAGDLGVGLLEGTVSAGMAIPQLANTLTGGAVDRYLFKPATAAVDRLAGGPGEGSTLAEASQDTRNALDTLKSDDLRQREQELADTKGFLPSLKRIVTDPTLLAQQVAEQVPQFVTPAGVTRKVGEIALERAAGAALARGTAKRVAAGMTEDAAREAALPAAQRLGQRAAIKAGTAAAIGSEAAVSASQNSEQAQQEVMGMDQSVLDANPDYRAMVAQGATPQDAREALAQQAGRRAAAVAGALTAATGGLTGKLESRIFQGEVGHAAPLLSRPGAKELGKAVAKEFTQEALQEGGEQFGQNVGVQSVDPNKDLMDQVPEQAALGGVIGGVSGGGLYAGSAALRTRLQHPRFAGAAPGSLSDAANTIDAAAGPISRAAAAAPTTQPPAAAPRAAEQTPALQAAKAEFDTTMRATANQGVNATRLAQEIAAKHGVSADDILHTPDVAPKPASSTRVDPGAPPWLDPTTGEVQPPTKEQLIAALADHIVRQQQATGDMRISTPAIAQAWGVPKGDVDRARDRAVKAARDQVAAAERAAMGSAGAGAQPDESASQPDKPASSFDKSPSEVDAGGEPDTAASAPVMVTQGMKRELRTLGHTDADIAKMTPQQAHDTLRAGEPVLQGARELAGEQGGPAVDQAVEAQQEQQKAQEDTGEPEADRGTEAAAPAGESAPAGGEAAAQPSEDVAAGRAHGTEEPAPAGGADLAGAGPDSNAQPALSEPAESPPATPAPTTATETPPSGGVSASGGGEPTASDGGPATTERVRSDRPLSPGAAMQLQEAHKALGRGVTRDQVLRMRDRLAEVVESGAERNGGVTVKLRPKALEARRAQLARLDADLSLFDQQTTPAPKPKPHKVSIAARDAEGLRVKTPDGEVNGRAHVDQLVARGFDRVESLPAGDRMVHRLVNAAGDMEPIKARQLKYAQEVTARAPSAQATTSGDTELSRREVPQYNPMRPAEKITSTLYRETNPEGAAELLDGMSGHAGLARNTVYAASHEHLAQGQGNNRGVLMELDPAGFDGRLNLSKPAARQLISSAGQAELEITPKAKSHSGAFIRSVTLKPRWKAGQSAAYANRVLLRLRQLEEKGWTKEKTEAGIVYRPPAMATGKEPLQVADAADQTAPLPLAEKVEAAAAEAASSPANDKPEPTEAQKEAGNYAKGHVSIQGLDISIENPRGSTRSGVGENGKPWSHVMSDHYGYIRRTEGADGDHVDVYVGPNPESQQVFVVDQLHQKTGAFDEHKVMLGFDSEVEAVKAYRSNFDKGWKVGPVHAMGMDEFKTWLKEGDTSRPIGEHVAAQQEAPATADAAPPEPTGKIEDLGEKIGGARKDTAAPTGARGSHKAKDDRPAWAKRWVPLQDVRSKQWVIMDLRTGRPVRAGSFDSMEAAEKAVPLYAVSVNHRASPVSDGNWALVRDVTDRKRVTLKDGFASREAVMRYMAEHAEQILAQKTGVGEEVLAKPEKAMRTGESRRVGDVGGQDFMDTFGFRGVEFGNWNNQAERQEVMNHAFDGLHDLAEVIGVPPRALSLNGELALAFGARGHGLHGARAHYERDYGVMNLTKMQGAGALAHEWFHALDHYLGRQDGKASSKKVTNARGDQVFDAKDRSDDYLSHSTSINSKVRPELVKEWRALIETMFRKAEKFVRDTEQAEAFVRRARDTMSKTLDNLRQDLARELTYGNRRKPATPEQLAEFDKLTEPLRNGQGLDTEWKSLPGSGKTFAHRYTNDILEGLNKLLKAVRNRQGFNAERRGPLDHLRVDMQHYVQRIKMLEEARAGDQQTKQVPTRYAMDAKAIDQGRASDYWTTHHEMAARAFSAYVEDKLGEEGRRSDFLSYGSDNKFYVLDGIRPFPEGEERKAIDAAFDRFFGELKAEEGEGGMVRLFSLDESGEAVSGRAARTFAEAREAARAFVGKPLANDKGLVPATVSNATLGKMLSDSAVRKSTSPADHMLAVANLDVLYRSGVLDETHADNRGEPTIAAIHRVVAPMVGADGQVRAVKMTVKETTHPDTPNPLYSVETLEVDPVEGAKPARNAPQSGIERVPGQDRHTPQAGFSADVTRMLDEFKKRLFRLTSETGAVSPSTAQDAHTARVRAVAEQAMARWKGEDVPGLRVEATPEQLPALAKRGPDGSPDDSYKRAAGMYDGRTIWIVASAHQLDQDGTHRILTTLAHEGIGHYGIDRIVQRELGADAWPQIQSAIERLRAAKAGSAGMRGVLESVERRYGKDAAPTLFARETLAVMAERGVHNGLLDRALTAVRRWLRKVLPSLKLSEAELRQLLVRSKEYLERGPSYAERVQATQAMAFSKQAQTDTPAFKRWFGNSKVVDRNGAPRAVYHGTAEDFDAFDPGRSGSATAHMTATLGTFFAEDRSKAQHYAENASQGVPADERIVDAYLSIQRPYVMGLKQFMGIDSQEEATALRNRLASEGYDGIHLKDVGQWVAFRPEQIKSASANRGTFDAGTGNIYFSLDDRGARADPNQPGKPFSRSAQSIHALQEGVPKQQESLLQAAKGWIAGKARDFEPAALGALQLRHVLELMEDSKLFPAAKQYAGYHQQMDADRQAQIDRGSELTQKWQAWAYEKGPAGWMGKLKPEAKQLARFIHDVTQLGIDPTDTYKKLLMTDSRGEHMPWTKELIKERTKALREQMRGRPGDDKSAMIEEIKHLKALPGREKYRESKYPELVARWNALPDKAKDIFRMARDRYQELSDLTERALLDRIEALSVPETYKRSLRDRIRFQFEANRVEGVYFPLSRFGDYWVSGSQRDGQPVFGMFESYREAEQAIQRLKAAGVEIEAQGLKDSDYKAKNAPSGTFVADVIGLLQKSGAPEKVQDEVYQLFLKTLPELSMRKHGIHRKNIAGFSDDALRAFAKNNFHSAHQIARLQHGFQMEAALEAMETAFENQRNTGKLGGNTELDLAQAVHGDALLGELKKRNDWIMSPKDSQMANVATSVGYLYYMSASPAAALVNLTQGAQVTLPVLGARHGWPKAMRALGAATRDALRTGGNIQRVLKTDEERQAFKVLEAQGTFQRTATHTLAGIAEGNALKANPAWARVMNVMGWLFHKAEVVNREAAGVAAFRLARGEGQTFDQAVRYADEIVNGTHFDYSNANRARYMQGNVPKILFQFKNYSVGMSWVLYRNLYKAVKGESPEVRRLARRTLTGVLGMTGLFAGVMGLPIINLLRYAANAAHAVGGDDDEPWDFNTEFRSWLAEHLGEDVARWVADGAVSQVTGANVASRVSLSDLWFRDPDRELEGRDAYYNYLDAIAGPLGGIAKNMLVGSQMIGQGHVERGVETILPKFIKDAMKSMRYASEGSNTLRGDPIVPDVSAPQAFLQAIGFQPTALREQQRINSALMNYQHEVQDRRQLLINAFAMAQLAGDDDSRAEALERIRAFNGKFPEVAIRMSNLHASLRTRAQRSTEAQNGIFLQKKLAGRIRQEVGAMAGE